MRPKDHSHLNETTTLGNEVNNHQCHAKGQDGPLRDSMEFFLNLRMPALKEGINKRSNCTTATKYDQH